MANSTKKSRIQRKLTGFEPWAHAEASAPEEKLSVTAREAILNEALRPQNQKAPLPALFAPARRLWLAGALPLALAVIFVAGLDRGVSVTPVDASFAPAPAFDSSTIPFTRTTARSAAGAGDNPWRRMAASTQASMRPRGQLDPSS